MHYSRTEKNRAPWIGAKNRPDLSLLQQTGKTVLFKHIDHLVAGIILPVSVSILLPTHHRIPLPRPSLAVVPLVLPHVATVRRLHHLPLRLSVPSSLRHRHLSRRRRTSTPHPLHLPPRQNLVLRHRIRVLHREHLLQIARLRRPPNRIQELQLRLTLRSRPNIAHPRGGALLQQVVQLLL